MRARLIAVFFCLIIAAASSGRVYADKPEQPPAGMGKFVLFLKQAEPVPPGQKPKKKIVEPDVPKLGGRVLHAKARRTIRCLY